MTSEVKVCELCGKFYSEDKLLKSLSGHTLEIGYYKPALFGLIKIGKNIKCCPECLKVVEDVMRSRKGGLV